MTYFILAVFEDMPNNLNQTDPTWTLKNALYNQSLVSSVVQTKLLACCYGFMREFVTSADIILL